MGIKTNKEEAFLELAMKMDQCTPPDLRDWQEIRKAFRGYSDTLRRDSYGEPLCNTADIIHLQNKLKAQKVKVKEAYAEAEKWRIKMVAQKKHLTLIQNKLRDQKKTPPVSLHDVIVKTEEWGTVTWGKEDIQTCLTFSCGDLEVCRVGGDLFHPEGEVICTLDEADSYLAVFKAAVRGSV